MNDIKLSITVMAHPSRERFFPYLSEKLGNPPFCVDQNNNIIANSRASWLKYDPQADFHLVVQDDAIIIDNFRERAKAFIEEQEARRVREGRPAQGYNFFLKQDRHGTPLWPQDGAYTDKVTRGGVAICLPVKCIPAMIAEFDRQRSRHDDDRISEYVKRAGMRILFPVPSLIGHRGDIPSVAGNTQSLDVWKFDGLEPVTIPKIIHQLWIGDKPAPHKWLNTWKEKHPGWEYKLWTNEDVYGRTWINQKHIDYYTERKEWHGVADVCTYEILHENGGFMIGADAICLEPIDELFYNNYDSYSVYEQEKIRPGLISPLHASIKDGVFTAELIEGLRQKDVGGAPWQTTGNEYMGVMYRKTKANVHIFPSHYFNSPHLTGLAYTGADKMYAIQKWGSTRNCYHEGI